jgi:hypothetical protein
MWLVGSFGLWFMHHSHRWYFLLLDGYDVNTLGQIGGYYFARVGAQLPALAVASIVIALSNFQRPVRAACLTAFAWHGLLTAVRLAIRPWSVAPDLDQSIPFLAELAQLTLLVAFTGLITWLFIWLFAALSTRQNVANSRV